MKIALNILISILLFAIMVDIENNSVSKKPDYSDSICLAGILLIFVFIRYYYESFKSYLITKK